MATNNLTLWVGSREFVTTTVLDGSTEVTAYDVTILPFGRAISTAVWSPVVTYSGTRGVWAEGLPVGAYVTFARVGPGAPNERSIVALGVFTVRDR